MKERERQRLDRVRVVFNKNRMMSPDCRSDTTKADLLHAQVDQAHGTAKRAVIVFDQRHGENVQVHPS